VPIRSLFVLVALLLPLPAAAQDDDATKFEAFAAELLNYIEGGRSIAVRPFKPTELPIAEDRANAFNDELVAALIRYSKGKHKFIRLDALRTMIAEKCELEPEKCDKMMETSLKNAGASILVVGRMRADGDDIKLSYEAYDLEQTTTLASTVPQRFVITRAAAAAAMAWEAALGQGGKYLSENTEDLKTLCRGRMTFQDTRIETSFGQFLIRNVADEVHRAATNLLSGGGVILGDVVDGTCPDGGKGGAYTLTGNYWVLGDQVSVRLALRNDIGQEVNIWPGQIRRNTIPDGLALQPTEEGERSGRGFAAIDNATSDAEAQLRARMQARLAMVASATNRAAPSGSVADTEAAREVLAALNDAVTYDERWTRDGKVERQGKPVWEAELRGRVRKLGGDQAPPIEVGLKQNDIVAGEPLVLTVRSPVKAYVGLYAWGADDKIVRLFPASPSEPVVVQPNAELILPPGGDGLTSGPLPESPLNTEALVVVASAQPIDFVALAAGVPGADVDATMLSAVPVNRFNEELRKLDKQTVTVRYVPYTVRGP
jgi:hypothetical protein